MGRALILSGGVSHDFQGTSGVIRQVLDNIGYDTTLENDIEQGLGSTETWGSQDLVVLNALRWSMSQERFAPLRSQWGFRLSREGKASIMSFLKRGGGLLVHHAGCISFDDWPSWQKIMGARWNWERSFHPPAGRVHVKVLDADDTIVGGLADFALEDEEVYSNLDLMPDLKPLLAAEGPTGRQPLLWSRQVQGGRCVYNALGHSVTSMGHPVMKTIIERSARWLAGGDCELS